MILKAEPCLVVSIQNQLTLCIGTMIVRQIPVENQNYYLATAQTRENKIAESFWKQNYTDAVLWISSTLWILRLNYLKFWHVLYKVADSMPKKKRRFFFVYNITDRPSD